jgi:hypothetical protein
MSQEYDILMDSLNYGSTWTCPACGWYAKLRFREDKHSVWVHQTVLCPGRKSEQSTDD